MRRRVLTMLVILLAPLAACGSDDGGDDSQGSPGSESPPGSQATVPGTDAEGSEPEAEPDVDPTGTVQLAYDLVASTRGGFTWDPSAATTTIGDLTLYQWVYGGLMRRDPDGALTPDLAEGVEIVDPSTIEVVMRDGVTMPDGSALDAEAVKVILEAALAKEGTPAFGDDFFNLSEIDVVDPSTLRLTIPDGTAGSWYDTFMSSMETLMVPPDTDFSKPAGAGPLTITEYVPEESVSLEKNPDYWDADAIQVAGVELLNAPDAQAGLNALRAGQVDFARVEIAQLDAIENPNEVIVASDPTRLVNLGICKDGDPSEALAEPQVRQALSKAIDREAINEAVFDGLAEPAWDLWPEGHRFHNPDLTEHYAYDPEGARELLAETGYGDGFTFDVLVIPAAGMPEVAQIVQQQLADIGVTMNLNMTPNYIEDRNNRAGQAGLVPTMSPNNGKLFQWTGNTVANFCEYNDPELDELAGELDTVSAESDDAVDLWMQINEKVVRDDALSIFVVFDPMLAAYNTDRLGDVELSPEAIAVPELRDMYVRG